MNRSMKIAFLCLAAMAADLTLAQTSPAGRLPANSAPRVNMLSGPEILCPSRLECPVPVTVNPPTGDGCEVTVSSKIKLAKQVLTKIVWTIAPLTFTPASGVTYSFQPDYGILVLTDRGRQMVRSGVGTTSTPNDIHHVFHLKNRDDDDVTYVPIIVKTELASKFGDPPVITLCGAIDPKIVNDGQ